MFKIERRPVLNPTRDRIVEVPDPKEYRQVLPTGNRCADYIKFNFESYIHKPFRFGTKMMA